jgi:hypothetical protein
LACTNDGERSRHLVIFEFSTAVKITVATFLVKTWRSVVGHYHCFRGKVFRK